MARVLILEPDGELRDLFSRVVQRLGHEPVLPSAGETPAAVDVVVLEPASDSCLRLARRVRAAQPGAAIICASIDGATEATTSLQPVSHLLKPFSLAELERAVQAVVPAAKAVRTH